MTTETLHAEGLIDAARARGIDGPVTLIAHDSGGAIAWYFALAGSRPLERLIVMNLPHPVRLAQGLRTLRQLRRSSYLFFFQLPWLPERLLAANRAAAIARIFLGMAVDETRFPRAVLSVYCRNARRPGALTAMLNYYRALGRELTVGTDALVRDFTLPRPQATRA
jgi:pimeloyl-ACP methyl ester carboxylesterase